jgi:hypothetical protein
LHARPLVCRQRLLVHLYGSVAERAVLRAHGPAVAEPRVELEAALHKETHHLQRGASLRVVEPSVDRHGLVGHGLCPVQRALRVGALAHARHQPVHEGGLQEGSGEAGAVLLLVLQRTPDPICASAAAIDAAAAAAAAPAAAAPTSAAPTACLVLVWPAVRRQQ